MFFCCCRRQTTPLYCIWRQFGEWLIRRALFVFYRHLTQPQQKRDHKFSRILWVFTFFRRHIPRTTKKWERRALDEQYECECRIVKCCEVGVLDMESDRQEENRSKFIQQTPIGRDLFEVTQCVGYEWMVRYFFCHLLPILFYACSLCVRWDFRPSASSL